MYEGISLSSEWKLKIQDGDNKNDKVTIVGTPAELVKSGN